MHSPTIAFIGAGNMGGCLIGGLIHHGYPNHKIWASSTNLQKLEHLQREFDINITANNLEAAKAAEVIVLAVKPNKIISVTKELAALIHSHNPLILSVAAGLTIETIQQYLIKPTAIVRAMPNIPAHLGTGATALFANSLVTNAQREFAESILQAVGIVTWLNDEKLMDAVTALSGSGPAYFFLFMEILEQTAEELGLPDDIAHLLTLQTALGAAKMAIDSGKSLVALRKQVTSPGGTTEKAIATLEENNFRIVIKKALQAARLRSEELSFIKEDK